MPCSFEAATVYLDFPSVRIFCSTFARTDCQEKFLVQNLEIQSCDSVPAVRQVGTNRSSHLKSMSSLVSNRQWRGISSFQIQNLCGGYTLRLPQMNIITNISATKFTSEAVLCFLQHLQQMRNDKIEMAHFQYFDNFYQNVTVFCFYLQFILHKIQMPIRNVLKYLLIHLLH